jgi:hypothetical protein
MISFATQKNDTLQLWQITELLCASSIEIDGEILIIMEDNSLLAYLA